MAPPINTTGMEFEVFLSFRGPDTRENFTSCLYSDMVEKGIRVFKDDEELRVGQEIGGTLLQALDDSQIYIPIFSKGFASSPWCLREVAHMVDCTSKSDGKKEILPVFFDVEPDHVKLKKELYRDALTEHENKYSSHEEKPWGDALVEVPTRVGWKLEGKAMELTPLDAANKLGSLPSGISILPYSIRRLKNLEHLLLYNFKNLHELPDSIGQMESLVKLDLQSSGITLLPNSIGNLKRLKVLNVAHTKMQTMPCALGGVETLEELDVSFCPHLVDEIPWEMWSLPRLRILNLYKSPISTVPSKISGFSSLQTLKIASPLLSPLPELPSSLEHLVVAAGEFPVSSPVLLHHLEVRKEPPDLTIFIPEELTSPWSDPLSIDQLPPSLSTLKLHSIPQLQDISDFQNLSFLSISECLMPHLPDLSRLKHLEVLQLSHFPELAEIPGLGELESLKYLHITMCDVIKQLPNLSKLRNLSRLELRHCAKLRAVEGLKEMEKLGSVVIRYCMSLERWPDVSAITKLETNWTPPEEPAEHAIRPAKRLRLWYD